MFIVDRRLHYNIKSMLQEHTSGFQYSLCRKIGKIILKRKNHHHIWIQRPRLPYRATETGSKRAGKAMIRLIIAVLFYTISICVFCTMHTRMVHRGGSRGGGGGGALGAEAPPSYLGFT